MKEMVEFECFEAMDKAGRLFKISGYQCYITHAPVYGQPVVLQGDIEYWTDTGMPVRKVDSKTYRIDTTKETITRLVEKFSFSSKKDIEVYMTNRTAN